MSGYSLEDRQNENQNYKHFSGKIGIFYLKKNIFHAIFRIQNSNFSYSNGMKCLFLLQFFLSLLNRFFACPKIQIQKIDILG